MSYNNTKQVTYNFGSFDASGADKTFIIRGPKGAKGRLNDVIVPVTTTCAGATTKPKIQVGKSGALTESCNLDMGVTAAGASLTASQVGNLAGANGLQGDQYSKALPIMAADTDVYITFKAATGAGAAGIMIPHVVIDWGF